MASRRLPQSRGVCCEVSRAPGFARVLYRGQGLWIHPHTAGSQKEFDGERIAAEAHAIGQGGEGYQRQWVRLPGYGEDPGNGLQSDYYVQAGDKESPVRTSPWVSRW